MYDYKQIDDGSLSLAFIITVLVSTVHFSVTLQSKFGMSATRILLFVDNFGA